MNASEAASRQFKLFVYAAGEHAEICHEVLWYRKYSWNWVEAKIPVLVAGNNPNSQRVDEILWTIQ